jgi:hypothetical protein
MVRALTGTILICVLVVSSCHSGPSRTTHKRSSDMSSNAEKIAFLNRYLSAKSAIEAAEFIIDYQDNSGGWVPGPSDWDIQAAMKMQPRDTTLWAEGLDRVLSEDIDLSWGMRLLPQAAMWRIESKPQIFVRPDEDVTVAIFQPEGIVFKRIRSR